MDFQKKTIKFIACILLFVFSQTTMAQIHVINADSIKLGEIAGTNGIAFYGRPYFKNIGLGKVSDSILVRQSDGQIKFVPRSLIFNGIGVDWTNVSGRPDNLSQFANGPGFVTSTGSVTYATSAGSAASVDWTNVSGRPSSLSAFTNEPGYVTSNGSVNYANNAGGVAWTNVSGRPSSLSAFTNEPGYVTSSGNVNYANSAGGVSWANVSGRPSALSQFSNDPGYVTAAGSVNYSTKAGSSTVFMSASHPDTYYLQNNWDGTRWNITSNHGASARIGYADEAGSVSWANVSGKPTYVSSFINDAGYLTSGGSIYYASVAGTVDWANVSSKPSYVSSFINDSGYLTAGGSINYANSSGNASTAGSTTNFMSTSHAGSFFLVNNWDGARWNITSNHGAPVRVGWADGAGSVDWSNVSNKPANYAVSGGPISQFDNDYGYARTQDMTLAGVANRGSDTPNNIYFYKGASDEPDQGSGISFSPQGGSSPSFSSMWQLGSNGDMINLGSNYGYWQVNFRLGNTGGGWLRGYLTQTSDIKFKKNIFELKSVSDNLKKVRAVEYDRTDSKDHQIGFIAQEFQKLFPDLVTESGGDVNSLGIAYSNFTVPLLKGWQEHDVIILSQLTKVKTLEDEVAALKNELNLLKEEFKQIKVLLKPGIK